MNGSWKTHILAPVAADGVPNTRPFRTSEGAFSGSVPIPTDTIRRCPCDKSKTTWPAEIALSAGHTLCMSTYFRCASLLRRISRCLCRFIRTAVRTWNHFRVEIPTSGRCRYDASIFARLAHLLRRFTRRIVQSSPVPPTISRH